MKLYTKFVAIFYAALCSATSVESNSTLETLVVTASADEIKTNQFGGSLTIITADQIEMAATKYLSDVLRQVPGFAVSQAGGTGTQTQIRVRGAESNHLLVMVDGIRVNDPAIGDEFLVNYALSDNVERIEIIRGPQSALWGTDALAGVINVITKKTTENHWGLQAEVGSFNTKTWGLNCGLNSGKLNWYGGIAGTDVGGSNISRMGVEEDGFDSLKFHFNSQFKASNEVSWIFQVSHNDGMNEYDAVDFLTSLPADSDDWTEVTQTQGQLTLELAPKTHWWQGLMTFQYSHNGNDSFTLGHLSTGSTESKNRSFKVDNQFRLNEQHRFNVMLDYRQTDFKQSGIASSFGDPNQDQSYRLWGMAAEYLWQVSDQWIAQLTARHDDFSRFDDVSIYNASTSYQLSENFRLRASSATGSKAPTFIERFGYTPNSFLGNPNLKPEESDAWEVGFDYQWNQQKLSLVYFDQNLNNEIDGFVFDPLLGQFTALNKEGDSQRLGVELVWTAQLTDDFKIEGNYTYTKATEEDAVGEQVIEIRRPKHLANLSLYYHFAGSKGRLFAQVRYQGKQYDHFFDPLTFVAVPTVLDKATTVDLTLSWALSDESSIYLKGQNIFDETQEEVLGYVRPGTGVVFGVKTQF